jgi:hypothetical protein
VSDGNGKPVGVEQGIGGPKYTITIDFDLVLNEINVTGLNVPPWIALGMLAYMEILVRRRELEGVGVERVDRGPRIALPGGPL